MYANTSPWAYNNEDFPRADDDSNASSTSDSDSEQELRDLEELLYSHVHYEPNYLYVAGTGDDLCSSDVHVTQLSDEVLDGLDTSAASNSEDSEVIVIDDEIQQEEVAQTASASGNLFSVQLKRKSETGESDDETRKKSKKVATAGSAIQSAAERNTSSLNLRYNQGNEEIIEVGMQEVCQPSKQQLAKKELKRKPTSSSVAHVAAAAKADSHFVVLDSLSESSSDVYCCDLSSVELSLDEEDDIKLSNINVVLPHMSDVKALADVLNSLSGRLLLANNATINYF